MQGRIEAYINDPSGNIFKYYLFLSLISFLSFIYYIVIYIQFTA